MPIRSSRLCYYDHKIDALASMERLLFVVRDGEFLIYIFGACRLSLRTTCSTTTAGLFVWPLVRCLVNIANIVGSFVWVSFLCQFVVTNADGDGDVVWVSFRIKAPSSSFCYGMAVIILCFCIVCHLSVFWMIVFRGDKPFIGFWLMILGIFLRTCACWCLIQSARAPFATSNSFVLGFLRAFVAHWRALLEWPRLDEERDITNE